MFAVRFASMAFTSLGDLKGRGLFLCVSVFFLVGRGEGACCFLHQNLFSPGAICTSSVLNRSQKVQILKDLIRTVQEGRGCANIHVNQTSSKAPCAQMLMVITRLTS